MRLGPWDIRIDRMTRFGNPYMITPDQPRDLVIELYRKYFLERLERDPEFKVAVERLRGSRLGCWCKPLACHGDVIVRYLEASTE
jgi:hypothetical protein